MKKKTRKALEEILNESSPPQGDSRWIIGGKIRYTYMWKRKYGTALRKYDIMAFNEEYSVYLKND